MTCSVRPMVAMQSAPIAAVIKFGVALSGVLLALFCGSTVAREATKHTVNDGRDKPFDVWVLSATPDRARWRTLDARRVMAATHRPNRLSSLDAMAEDDRDLGRPRSFSRYLIAASMPGDSRTAPAGLLITDSQVRSTLDSAAPSASPKNSAPCGDADAGRFRLPVVLCATAEGKPAKWTLSGLSDYKAHSCAQAIQLGPEWVRAGGQVSTCLADGPPVAQLGVCLDKSDGLHVVLTSATQAVRLARWLAQGPLKCQRAVNLTREGTAGWIKLRSTAKPLSVDSHGVTEEVLGSALLVEFRP